jgi:hypothetical protein
MYALLCLILLLLPACSLASDGSWTLNLLDRHSPRAALSNPAWLAEPMPTRFSVEVPGAGAIVSNNSFSVGYWNAHIAGDGFWDAAETRDILSHIPQEGLVLQTEAVAPALGVRYRQWSFNARAMAGVRAGVPKELAEMALVGVKLDRGYSLSDFIGETVVAADYSIGYGRTIPQKWIPTLAAGACLHYYDGLGMTKVLDAHGNLHTSSELLQGSADFRAATSTSGHGFGLDLGLAATLSPRWRAGLTVQNIGGALKWSLHEIKDVHMEADEAGLVLDSLDSESYTDSVFQSSDTTYEGGRLISHLPTVVCATAQYRIHPRWTLAASLGVATLSTAFGPRRAEVGTAAEFLPRKWAALRGGILLGGAHRSLFSFGSGLRFRRYEMDLDLLWAGGLFNGASGGGAAISQRVFF